MSDLVQELTRIYYDEEEGFKEYLTPYQAEKYFTRLLEKDRILTVPESWNPDKGSLEAYCEFWTITTEQYGRVRDNFLPEEEDINNGELCYIFKIWVRKDKRNTDILRQIRKRLIKKCPNAEYFVYEEQKHGDRPRSHKIRR